ncbi:MAG: winged helix-turn-helix domain-containing protein [Bellilinea sp.]
MMSKTSAAYLILKEAGKPLTVREILLIALSRNLFNVNGKTPETTLNADLHNENMRRKGRGERTRFTKVAPKTWALTEWNLK